ncbi:helix-turn-helix transcriptional regulator [Flexithrix dorotheae]|uniref:helix-turn-helix transcriptional regulator n=1 Tax=Flexithrix dorotheae TaxID=70993 RepID=UPI000364C29C|nr:AraC family transcriptional regulator [Flexithrix dorotheae]
MKFSLRTSDIEELIYEQNILANPACFEENSNPKFELDIGFLKGAMEVQLFEDYYFHQAELISNSDLKFYASGDQPCVEIHFHLQGFGKGKWKGFKEETIITQGECNIFYSPEPQGVFETEAHVTQKVFEVNLMPENFVKMAKTCGNVFHQFIEDIEAERPSMLVKGNMPISPNMQIVLFQMMNSSFEDPLRTTYFQAKVFELLTLIAGGLQLEKPQFSFGKEDEEKFYFAKEQLIKNVANPPSLSELAKMSGLNEFKLKKGFKEIFGNSVFGYLLDFKLEKAKQLLVNPDLSIGDVAFLTGYKNQGHFTTAFKKKYGVTPNFIKQN